MEINTGQPALLLAVGLCMLLPFLFGGMKPLLVLPERIARGKWRSRAFGAHEGEPLLPSVFSYSGHRAYSSRRWYLTAWFAGTYTNYNRFSRIRGSKKALRKRGYGYGGKEES